MLEGLLSIEIGLMFWQTVTILVVGYVLKRFAWKHLLAFIEQEENKAEEVTKKAQKAHDTLATLHKMGEKIINEAKKKQQEVMEEARKTKLALLEEASQEAAVEKAKRIAEAQQIIKKQKATLQETMKYQTAHLAVAIAKKAIQVQLESQKNQEILMEKLIEEASQVKKTTHE